MADYISREDILKKLKSWYSELEADKDKGYADELAENEGEREAIECCIAEIESIKAADVQPVNQWISVDDKLPDTVDDCLVWYSCDTAFGKSKSVGISFCSRDDWYKKHLNGDNIVVLYWMPLPEPPKDGDAE